MELPSDVLESITDRALAWGDVAAVARLACVSRSFRELTSRRLPRVIVVPPQGPMWKRIVHKGFGSAWIPCVDLRPMATRFMQMFELSHMLSVLWNLLGGEGGGACATIVARVSGEPGGPALPWVASGLVTGVTRLCNGAVSFRVARRELPWWEDACDWRMSMVMDVKNALFPDLPDAACLGAERLVTRDRRL